MDDFQQTKIGFIPQNWEIKKLSELVKIQSSNVNKKKSPDENRIKLCNYKHVFDNEFIDSSLKFMANTASQKEIKKNKLFKGDIIITKDSETREDIAKPALVAEEIKNLICGYHLVILKPTAKEIDNYYLTLCFLNPEVHKIIMKRTNGITRFGLRLKTIRNLPIPLPPIEEQEIISSIIKKWNHAISLVEDLIQAKKRYKKGLMQQLLSGKKRFPEFVSSDEKFETKFGNYPTDWNYVKIRTFTEELKDRKSEGITDYTVLSCTKYDGLVDSLEYFDRQVFSDDLSNYKVVEKGSFAYATNHIEEGSIGYNDWCDVGLISPMYKVFKTDSKKINDQFLYKLFKTEKYRHIFEINTNGTVNRRGSLRWRGFSNIKVPLPPLEEQNKIAEVLKESEKEIELLEQKLEAIKKQKKGLMQQLLTGKIRVQSKEVDYAV